MKKLLIKTRHFGEVDLDESKIIYFENGIMGFENFKRYTVLYDSQDGGESNISWLQSLDEPALALPVISPFLIKEDYNPVIEDELLNPLGLLNQENTVVLVTITVPKDIKKISANLKAPFIMNADTMKGCQVIVDNNDYEIKHYFYERLQELKEAKGVE
jgi:flagellar assembly factor FliW